MLRTIAMLALCVAAPAVAQQVGSLPPADARIAWFGLSFLDTSTEGDLNGVREDETQRLEMLEEMVRARFREAGYDFMDTAPVDGQLSDTVNPAQCYGCDMRMGEDLGAEYVLLGEVQKVSNLILNMNLQMREVPSGDIVLGRAADIRSNTDEAWTRGMAYILDNAFFFDGANP